MKDLMDMTSGEMIVYQQNQEKIRKLNNSIAEDILFWFDLAEQDLIPKIFGDVLMDNDENVEFFSYTLEGYSKAQINEIKLKLFADIAKIFVEAKTARMIAEGLKNE